MTNAQTRERRHRATAPAEHAAGCGDGCGAPLLGRSAGWLRGPALGSWEDVPEYQRRPFILGGYRLDTEGCLPCLRSAASLHNETVNIWSHALGILVVAAWLRAVLSQEGGIGADGLDGWLVVGLALVTVNCLFWSAFYHTRHCDVEAVCYGCFYFDLGGVVLLLGASLAVGIALGFKCMPAARSVYLLGVLAEICVMAAVASWSSAPDSLRAKVFAACGLLGLVPAAHFLLVAPGPLVEVMLPRLLGVLLAYLGGAVVYVLRCPESWLPGRFDYLGQSHNLWHLCVLAGMLTWLDAMQRVAALQAVLPC